VLRFCSLELGARWHGRGYVTLSGQVGRVGAWASRTAHRHAGAGMRDVAEPDYLTVGSGDGP
jgi:hypothetical protein